MLSISITPSAYILNIPYRLLFPLIIMFCFIGVYSLNNNFYELLIMIFFGFSAWRYAKAKKRGGGSTWHHLKFMGMRVRF